MHQIQRRVKLSPLGRAPVQGPPRFVEYAYYLSVFYAVAGVAFGVSVPFLGVGCLAVIAAFCVGRLGSRAPSVYAPIIPALLCAISTIAIQVFVHHELLMDDYVRSFVTWIPALIVVQSLSLSRGFLHRFALATFGMGLMTLPFGLTWPGGTGVDRLALDSTVGLSNPNDLAAWFGFCAVYFIIRGIQTRQGGVRIGSLLAALGSVYVVGLTVSRGKLLAVAVAAVFALRHVLKRGFLPILLLLMACGVAYSLGLFDRITGFYVARGTVETGRLLVWPLALERFLNSPLVGVGASNISTYVSSSDHPIEPHNGLLHIALASGIAPLMFFVAYWIRAIVRAFRASTQHQPDAPYLVPLVVYAFLVMWIGNATFMFSWMIVTLSAALTAGTAREVPRVVAPRIRVSNMPGPPGPRYEARRRGTAGYQH